MHDYSVIIPAHDEARVIAATLSAFPHDATSPAIWVICNGCNDDTAAVARAACPVANVLEIDIASKAVAINHGLDAAPPGIVIVLDADVGVDVRTLDALAGVLGEENVCAAAPAATLDLAGTDRWVSDYYRVFAAHAYMMDGVGGSGVYGLSSIGRQLLGRLPAVMSDDDYIRHFFSPDTQRRVRQDRNGNPLSVRLRPPRHVRELILNEARWRAGDALVRRNTAWGDRDSGERLVMRLRNARHMLREGGIPASALARYGLVKLAGRGLLLINRLRRRAHLWHRDDSSRVIQTGEAS